MRDFIGHEALINNFKQRCLKNTLSHAHLIAGEDGVGKGKLANILAKFILNGYLDREYVDIINYSSEKSSFGVDDVKLFQEACHAVNRAFLSLISCKSISWTLLCICPVPS